MKIDKNKYYIVRADRAGVFAGNIEEFDASTATVTMRNARRLWYWDGAASISQLAVDGTVAPEECKFTVTVDEIAILGVIEVVPCTEKAEKSIKAVVEWHR